MPLRPSSPWSMSIDPLDSKISTFSAHPLVAAWSSAFFRAWAALCPGGRARVYPSLAANKISPGAIGFFQFECSCHVTLLLVVFAGCANLHLCEEARRTCLWKNIEALESVSVTPGFKRRVAVFFHLPVVQHLCKREGISIW